MASQDALITLLAFHRGMLDAEQLAAVNEAYWQDPATPLSVHLRRTTALSEAQLQVLQADAGAASAPAAVGVSAIQAEAPVDFPRSGRVSSSDHPMELVEQSMQSDLYATFYRLDDKIQKLTKGTLGLAPVFALGLLASVLATCIVLPRLSLFGARANASQPVPVAAMSLSSNSLASDDKNESRGAEAEGLSEDDIKGLETDEVFPASNVVGVDENAVLAEALAPIRGEGSFAARAEARVDRMEQLLRANEIDAALREAQSLNASYLSGPLESKFYHLYLEMLLRSKNFNEQATWRIFRKRSFKSSQTDLLWELQLARLLMRTGLNLADMQQDASEWDNQKGAKYAMWIGARANTPDAVRKMSLQFTSTNDVLDGYFLGVALLVAGEKEKAKNTFRFLLQTHLDNKLYSHPNPTSDWLIAYSLQDLRERCLGIAGVSTLPTGAAAR